MFANPLWSVLIIVGTLAIYWLIIRPRLKVAFSETYLHIDGWWARQWARIVAFRSYAATLLAAVLIAAPDIVVAILPVDLSGFIGPKWAPMVTALLTVFLALNRAFSTKPGEEK